MYSLEQQSLVTLSYQQIAVLWWQGEVFNKYLMLEKLKQQIFNVWSENNPKFEWISLDGEIIGFADEMGDVGKQLKKLLNVFLGNPSDE